MNATQARAEAVRKYFTKTPSRPSYFLTVMLALNAAVFALITLWIVISSLRQAAQVPPPQPAPQETVQQQQPPPSSEPQQTRSGKRRRRQAAQQPATQSTESTTTQTTTTQTTSVQAAPAQQQRDTSCGSCASTVTGAIAVISALLAAWWYSVRRNTYIRAWHHAEPKPSDAQIDAWHYDDVERLKKGYALGRLDLVNEQVRGLSGPLTVVGLGPSPQFRRGQNGRIRFSQHEALVIYLTDYHLAAFKCVIDLHDGRTQTETTQEYHYDDVVSVSTQTNNSPLVWYEEGQAQSIPTHQRFAISVASGDQISVAVAAEALDVQSDLELTETIKTIRTKLREKKGGSIDPGQGPLI
jgi:hypothetical protein